MYWPILLWAKSQNPRLDFKLIDGNTLLDLLSFRFQEDPIPALLQSGLDYSSAKKWVRILRLAGDSDHPKVVELRKIVDPYMVYDPLAKVELSRYSIALFEMDEDVEYHALIQKRGYASSDVHFSDFGIVPWWTPEKNPVPFFVFRDKADQMRMVFSLLRDFCLRDDFWKGCILHVDESPSNSFYLSTYSSLFDVPVFLRTKTPLRAFGSVAKMVNSIYASRSFEVEPKEEMNEEEAMLLRLIDHYRLKELPFEKAFVNLQEILASQAVQQEETDRGIGVGSNFLIDPEAPLIVTDFQDGRFYKTYADDNVLTDIELASLSLNTSYVLTSLDRRNKDNYLRYSRVVFLSRVEQHLQDKIYDSPFVEEWARANPDFQKKTDAGGPVPGVYTTGASRLALRVQCDAVQSADPGQFVPDLYSQQFKGLLSYSVPKNKKFSISAVKKYASCPFAYYLQNLIPDKNSDKTAILIGVLFHKFFENAYRDDFEFEASFQEGVEAYRAEAEKNGQVLTGKDEVFFDVYRRVLSLLTSQIREFRASSRLSHDRFEQPVEWSLSDGKQEFHFRGVIDKILYFGTPGKGFYYVLDYKTGSESFEPLDIPYGGSIQLPMYLYALTESQNAGLVQGYEFFGFGIERILSGDLVAASGKDGFYSRRAFEKNLTMKGVALNSLEGWQAVDSTGLKEDKKTGEFTVKGGQFVDAKILVESLEEGIAAKGVGPYKEEWTLTQLIDAAKKICLAAAKEIERGNFPIAPTSTPLHKEWNPRTTSCRRCPYKDVCYRKVAVDHRSFYCLDSSVFAPREEK
ncbi:MAG: PD-(D/E)XK nuclease family protein [Candidatus Enteromonas sp.]|nr:PD-(D/E)XK nuclease family protein [Candidatus Enteromonas sp.]